MITGKNGWLEIGVESYVNISNFSMCINANTDPYLVAVIIGCIEGNIQLYKDKHYFTFNNMYKINYSSNYKIANVYSIIKKHSDYYRYIISYFNLWHGNDYEEFTYDEYHKDDLNNNLNNFVSLMREEMKMAKEKNEQKIIDMYSSLLDF